MLGITDDPAKLSINGDVINTNSPADSKSKDPLQHDTR